MTPVSKPRTPGKLDEMICILVGIIACLCLVEHCARADELPAKTTPDAVRTEIITNANTFADTNVLWIDRVNDAVFRILERPVELFDGLFATAKEREENQRLRNSTFRVRLNMEMREEGGLDFSFQPDFKLDFYLPHLNRRLHLVARSADIDDLPDQHPAEQDDEYLVGLASSGQTGFWRGFYLGGGVKIKSSSQPYATVGWHRSFRISGLRITPHQRFFWAGDDGFGEITTLGLQHPVGSYLITGTTSGAKWSEDTIGVQLSQSAYLDWYWRGNQRPNLDRTPKLGLKGVVLGHKSSSGIVDKYRIETPFRYPLRKKWLVGNIMPFVEFPNDRDWNATYGVWFALDIYFDGSASPRPVPLVSGEDDTPDSAFDEP